MVKNKRRFKNRKIIEKELICFLQVFTRVYKVKR